uniref:Movement protein TGB2 n=1 Tax=Narcissus common latent virus TaxID=160844 RepID=A8W8Y9_9VIRU|nr:triple gene block protein 2 [Narcissus common latent virus]
MPLTPPRDFTKVYIAAAIGATFALVTWLLTKNTLPAVGDRDHNLPHGGLYRDGTKAIKYNSPCKLNSIEGDSRGFWTQPWALVSILSILIIISSRFDPRLCRRCGTVH